MKPSFTLSIPNPCSEDWKTFTPTSTGGFCGSCQKNVIDFSKATDDEIIAFIIKKPEHACGRFRDDQLKKYIISPSTKIRPGFPLLKASMASLLLLLLSKSTFAHQPLAPWKTEITAKTGISPIIHTDNDILVKGVVKSESDGEPLPGVSVVAKGTVLATQTNADGAFEIRIPSDKLRTLTFSFIGLKTKEVVIDATHATHNLIVILEDDTSVLGEIIWTGQISSDNLYTEQSSWLKKLWSKINNFF